MGRNRKIIREPEQLDQTLDLPADGEGLAWIARHNPGELLLIPGLHATSITAAAAGHQQAFWHLRTSALAFAALRKRPGAFDSFYSACMPPVPKGMVTLEPSVWKQLRGVFLRQDQHTVHVMHDAAREVESAAMKWLLALCHPADFDLVTDGLVCTAVAAGRLNILRYLQQSPYSFRMTRQTVQEAYRHPDCLRWLLEQDPPCFLPHDVLVDLARQGDLDTLAWLHAHNRTPKNLWTGNVTEAAARCGNMEGLQWLRGLDPPCRWDATSTMAAAANSDWDMLKWMRSVDPPCGWDCSTTTAAARAGNIPLLQWLRTQHPPCPWDASAMYAAVESHDLAMLQWLRAQSPPAPWQESCTIRAAALGNLTMLAWLLRAGCPYSSFGLYSHAAYGSQTHVLEWLHTQRIPLPGTQQIGAGWAAISVPSLMFLGDISYPLNLHLRRKLAQARRTFCMFHGLLRWCPSAVGDSSARRAFDNSAADQTGQHLLVHLSMLPQDLIRQIAVAAQLQHGLRLAQDATSAG